MSEKNKFYHVIRYGTAAEQHLLGGEFLKTYDLLALNANIVAHTPTSISKFLAEKCLNKPYFIDPQTHAFQHDVKFLNSKSKINPGKIKGSLSKLITYYGDPISKKLLDLKPKPVLPSDVVEHLESFSANVLRFQKEYLSTLNKKNEADKYYKFLEKKGIKTAPKKGPYFLVAPYFYLTPSNYKEWVDVNILCAQECIRTEGSDKIAVELVISKEVLESPLIRNEIVQKYKVIKPKFVLLWIDSFHEESVSFGQAESYVKLISELSDVAPVINLYAGFYSIILGRSGFSKNLVGATHSMEYGENRSVVPVGGGIPVSKYYYPLIHYRLHFRDALKVIKENGFFESSKTFFDEVCACKECKKNIIKDPENDFAVYGETKTVPVKARNGFINRQFSTVATKSKCIKHYLWVKHGEYNASQFSSKAGVLKHMNNAIELCENSDLNSLADQIKVWKDVISQTGQ